MMKKVIVAGCVLLAAVVCSMAFFLPGRGLPDGEQEAQHVLRVVLWDYDTVSYDRRIIQAFEAQNPDITVEVTSYSPTYYDFSLEALLASDEQIDVIYGQTSCRSLHGFARRSICCRWMILSHRMAWIYPVTAIRRCFVNRIAAQ